MNVETATDCIKAEELSDMLLRISSLEALHDDVKEIKKNVEEVKELLSAWNNIKGFGTTMKWIATGVKVIAIVGAAVGAIYLVFTGHQPK